MKKLIAFILFLVVGVIFAKVWFEPYDISANIQSNTLTLVPSKTLHLDVPDIGAENPVKRVCEIRIPEHYKADKPVPLLVWFSPGGGSGSVRSVPNIVDFSEFLVVAIPYPDNKLPRLAIKAGKEEIDSFWEYEKPMLEYIRDIVPNISESVRIVGGFSSGAHLVGAGLDRDWLGFTDFFTAYIMHEGGYAPEMTYSGVKDVHKILITYGLQNNSYGRVVVREMKKAGLHPTVKKLPNTGHNMSQEAIGTISGWIEYIVMPTNKR